MVFIIETLVAAVGATGVLAAVPYLSYVGYAYRFQVLNIMKYKHTKKKIYKGIYKAIEEQDIQALRDYFLLLSRFDAKYDRQKSVALKKKLGICDELLSDRKIFKMKFDSEYLVETMKGLHSSSDLDISKREKELIKREKELDDFSGFDGLRKKEAILNEKEKELIEREKEIIEIISNLSKL